MERILIADDSEINRELLATYLDAEYEVAQVEDGAKALEDLEQHGDTAILLLDLYMPNMDGFEVLKQMGEKGLLDSIPVIIISGENSAKVESDAFDMGVTDFIHKPYDVTLVRQRVRNAVELFATRNRLEDKVEQQTREIRAQYGLLEEQKQILEKQKAALEAKTIELEETNRKIIDVLGTTVEFRHMDSYMHIRRVKAFTRTLAQQVLKDFPEYGLDQDEVDLIVDASSLHDIGKISIPDSVLLKPGRLTKEEFDLMKTHTTKGGAILKRVHGIWDERFGKACYDICMYHHERYDGRGYPEGLVGEEIPLSAQIVSVVDVYDALVCKRVYKDAIPKPEAARMILEGECGTFSPKLLEAFRNCRETLELIADTIIGQE